MTPIIGKTYTWRQVTTHFQGEQTFLAKRDGRIVCATLVKESNPEAPEVMVVGGRPRNMRRAEEFCEQGGTIPVFIKHAVNQWEFVGHYEFVSFATDRETLRRHERISGDGLTRVIYLRRIDEPRGMGVTDAELDELPTTGREGRERWRRHLHRERNRTIVSMKKADTKRLTGRLACEACKFEFGKKYGLELEDFCEVHHRVPFSKDRKERATRLEDLAVLCANCHRAIHRLGPSMPTVEEFAARISLQA
jgi:predicted HNH restriction endonuclease